MKRVLTVAGIVVCMAIGGCSSTSYVIKLRHEYDKMEKYESYEKPILNEQTGYYEFIDKEGNKVQLKEEDVLLISEQ